MAIERTARDWRHALRNPGSEARAEAAAPAPFALDTNGDGFDEVIDLTGLASRPGVGFIIQGDAAGDRAGYSVSSAGDINGDGFDDFIVGAPRGNDGGTQAGEAYVIFGRASPFGTIDLTNLGSAGFVIQGDFDNDYAGYSVSTAGDVNGDGFDDLIVGAFRGDDGGSTNAGKAYVIFGKASGFGTIDLASLGTAGFTIQGDANYDTAGFSVASAGDVNGDGFDDVIVGAPRGDDGGFNAGEAYVIFGKSGGFGTIDLTSLGSAGFIIQGDAVLGYAGWSVASAGDVNGDGFDDLIVGAPKGDDGGTDAGEAYVIFGKATPFGTIDLASLGSAGFIVQGDLDSDRLGTSVGSAGDINGDGFDDVIVGAPYAARSNSTGLAYVIFGKASGFGTIDVANIGAAGFAIQGAAGFDDAGRGVSSAGDVNGDGFEDLIVGAAFGSDGGSFAGGAYLIFGKAGGFGTIDLSTFHPSNPAFDPNAGFFIQGDASGDRAGTSVAGAGDINDDGFDDLIVGAPYGNDGGSQAGEAYVILGHAPTVAVTRTGSIIGQTIRGGAFDDTLDGREGNDQLVGYAGNDMLIGGTGNDRMTGGLGNDIYYVDAAGDVVTELSGEGTDEVRTALADYTLPDNVEILTATAVASGQTLRGNAGDNIVTGSGQGDSFRLEQGGNDSANGGGGDDGFFFGAAFTAADHVDGGAGSNDQIGLQGNYTGSNALVLGATTIANVEAIVVLPGFSYDITTVDGNVAAGGLLKVQATPLAAGQNLTFNGSAEHDGSFIVYGGQGNDSMTGGDGNDGFYFGPGGFNASDIVNGGAGTNDQLALDGDYTITLGGNVANVEVLVLLHGPAGTPNHFNLTAGDAFVPSGQTMTIFGLQVDTAITFDGSGEHDGAFRIYGGQTGDTLTGSTGNDWIFGGNGGDALTGGLGSDTFFYDAASQSTSTGFDRIIGFDDSTDTIDLPFAVTGFAAPGSGNLSTASFDSDLASAFTGLTSHEAGMFTATGGDMAGRAFLVIDADGNAGYQAGSDYVIEIISPATPIDQPGMFV
ncbi:MAG TPA: hypothetical protein VK614_02210 [Allosphingosinicella sp.]|nr:hypothetical protein [Allosphingosinicella sp.]